MREEVNQWLREATKELELARRDFLDKISEFLKCWNKGLPLEVFPYTINEVKRLMNRVPITIYDALDHGIVIHDDGTFEELRTIFKDALSKGIIRRVDGWWTIPEKPLLE